MGGGGGMDPCTPPRYASASGVARIFNGGGGQCEGEKQPSGGSPSHAWEIFENLCIKIAFLHIE